MPRPSCSPLRAPPRLTPRPLPAPRRTPLRLPHAPTPALRAAPLPPPCTPPRLRPPRLTPPRPPSPLPWVPSTALAVRLRYEMCEAWRHACVRMGGGLQGKGIRRRQGDCLAAESLPTTHRESGTGRESAAGHQQGAGAMRHGNAPQMRKGHTLGRDNLRLFAGKRERNFLHHPLSFGGPFCFLGFSFFQLRISNG